MLNIFIHVDGNAGEMVNPSKTAAQVNTESLEGKELYKVSHNDFDVGKYSNFFANKRECPKHRLSKTPGQHKMKQIKCIFRHIIPNLWHFWRILVIFDDAFLW